MYTMMQVCQEPDMRNANSRCVFDDKDVKWIKDLNSIKGLEDSAGFFKLELAFTPKMCKLSLTG